NPMPPFFPRAAYRERASCLMELGSYHFGKNLSACDLLYEISRARQTITLESPAGILNTLEAYSFGQPEADHNHPL
ncbi:MAG: hypothetical protein U9Q58_02195, partial [Pseudomonadota bacterium]|nr:hypothetical protein [Pseudomonadota bacterium]